LADHAPTGGLLRAYLAATAWAAPLAERHLENRLARGKEHPDRWREKLGEASHPRPDGPLVWMHAVGLGEVLALRGLIEAMHRARPDLQFLVTSSARASGEVFDRNRPPRTLHQYLPLDAGRFVARFLNHWRPNLSAWAEQDLWPRFVVESHARGIPLAMINARMNDRALASRRKAGRFYGDLYARFALLAAQDAATARNLQRLAPGAAVEVMGSLKAACAPLADSPDHARLKVALAGRRLWCAASTHPADEAVVLAAQARRFAQDPASLLVLAPRLPDRRDEISAHCARLGLRSVLRSEGAVPGPQDAVWIADSFGEMGLWYRLCPVSLIGGSFGDTGGHNPWEAASLGSAILHGPNTANFGNDYAALALADAARDVSSAESLGAALSAPGLDAMAARAAAVQARSREGVAELRDRLLALIRA
jgi:3-deoxy-D-manno-octulosonic-acid transferase